MSFLEIHSLEELFEKNKNGLLSNNILIYLNTNERNILRKISKKICNTIPKTKYVYFPYGRFDELEGKIEMKFDFFHFPLNELNFGFVHVISSKSIFDHFFAGIKRDQSVITWGKTFCMTMIYENVIELESTRGAFAALTDTGGVISWGSSLSGGDSREIPSRITTSGVKKIFATAGAFAALLFDNRCVVWGDKTFGGNNEDLILLNPENIHSVVSNMGAFCALKFNGSVICWGAGTYGGKGPKILEDISQGVIKITQFSHCQFCAIKENGVEIIWPEATNKTFVTNKRLLTLFCM